MKYILSFTKALLLLLLATLPVFTQGEQNGSSTETKLSDGKVQASVDEFYHSYDPKSLMPLAVGNSWKYRWHSSVTEGDNEVKTEKPFSMFLQGYEFGGKNSSSLGYRYKCRTHEEVYTIVRCDGQSFFFTVESNPKLPATFLRDGRYEDSVENAWTWWQRGIDDDREVGLTESIKRQWSYPHNRILLGNKNPPKGEYPSDDRISIHLKCYQGRWGNDVRTWHILEMHDYKFVPITRYSTKWKEVIVAAGQFKECLETVVEAYKYTEDIPGEALGKYMSEHREMLLFETHTYWARGVGMVQEFQKLQDGTLAYNIELVEFHTQ